MTDWNKLVEDLVTARVAATEAARATGDGGTCNFDNVRLLGIRWSKGLERALAAAGVRGHRRQWLGRSCIELDLGAFGQAGKNAAAAVAANKALSDRGWRTTVFYAMD